MRNERQIYRPDLKRQIRKIRKSEYHGIQRRI